MAMEHITNAATSFAMNQVLFSRADEDGDFGGDGCSGGNEYDGRMGVRISSIFVIFIGSLFGAVFPVYAKRHAGTKIPEFFYFFSKFFGSGVIIATAFMHLLVPAIEALGNECLTGPIADYAWPEAICLMAIFVLFFCELMTMRLSGAYDSHSDHDAEADVEDRLERRPSKVSDPSINEIPREDGAGSMAPGVDHLGHARSHIDNDASPGHSLTETIAAQITSVMVLEFGIVFHSVFVGLTLAVSGDEFTTLYIVLVFHQTFEGLGLGSRLSTTPWPKGNSDRTPYLLGLLFAFTTPIAIAIGLGVRTTYSPGSRKALMVNGIFDSISAGILIYTGLVELLAHEFMFSPTMQKASNLTVISAVGLMALGAGLMALLGYWA